MQGCHEILIKFTTSKKKFPPNPPIIYLSYNYDSLDGTTKPGFLNPISGTLNG